MNLTNLGDNPQNIMAAGFEDAFKDHIRNATPLVYFGAIAGSEFLTYVVTKMYIAFEFSVGYTVVTLVSNGGIITFYNTANAVQGVLNNNIGAWDTTAAGFKYMANSAFLKNFYFSRLTAAQYNYMQFIGFRVTLY